jgi:hypothetical protein
MRHKFHIFQSVTNFGVTSSQFRCSAFIYTIAGKGQLRVTSSSGLIRCFPGRMQDSPLPTVSCWIQTVNSLNYTGYAALQTGHQKASLQNQSGQDSGRLWCCTISEYTRNRFKLGFPLPLIFSYSIAVPNFGRKSSLTSFHRTEGKCLPCSLQAQFNRDVDLNSAQREVTELVQTEVITIVNLCYSQRRP